MRLLVTGGTGFIGAETVRQALARGDEVAVASRAPLETGRLRALAGRLVHIPCDLDTASIDRDRTVAFAPDALLHFGWAGVGGAERNDVAQLRNAYATGVIAEVAAQAGARALIGFGSQAEYGRCEGRVDEDRPARPETLYGIAKLAAGASLLQIAARHDLRGAWGRIFSTYGAGGDPRTLIPSLLEGFTRGVAPELTRCEQVWELLHVEDAARAALALAESEPAAGLFNIGSGAARSLREIVLLLRDLAAPAIEPRFGALPYRHDQVMHLEADIGRIIGATGWRPRVSLERGFAALAAQMRRAA
jgi:nucleoside-diphosphate-sugar epimerase